MALKKPIVDYNGKLGDMLPADTIPPFNLGGGLADSTTFLRGDGVFAVPPSAGGSSYVYTTIDFGVLAINEKQFTITDASCTATSKIDISTYNISQTEENFGVKIDIFTESLVGSFKINAVSTEPFSRGVFNIKYKIL